MQLLQLKSDELPRPCVATIGFFDGVHLGHCYLIEQVCEIADQRNYASAVITFPKHPRQIIKETLPFKLLTTWEEKLSLLSKTKLDYCIALDFTKQLAALSAHDFMLLLRDEFNVRALLIGYDHRFGHNRSDGFENYVQYGKDLGIEVLHMRAFKTDAGVAVSSSGIRNYILTDRVSEANELLGYDYFLEGTVVGGRQLGRKIGYPTANLQVDSEDKVIPSDGVYAVLVTVDNRTYQAMLSIGIRPTINNGTDRTIEAHLFDFNSDIYGKKIKISFVCYVRPEEKFETLDMLIDQLHKDAIIVKQILSNKELK